ncbi:MAG: GNAT family N-acetyltransferase [Clostridia bacterium]|nr:GNAT family N-acetyltransferase [Clostridia bacterium]
MINFDGKKLFYSMHPNFFEDEYIKSISSEKIYDEQILFLDEYDHNVYNKNFDDNISFGFYDGDLDEFKKSVALVVERWTLYFREDTRIYCAYLGDEIASFCMVEDMGLHYAGDKIIKVGGPGCVGTIPKYRNLGIGLTMVNNVTQILKDEGYDVSYIHYTGVPNWYRKLGYETYLRWNKFGPLE